MSRFRSRILGDAEFDLRDARDPRRAVACLRDGEPLTQSLREALADYMEGKPLPHRPKDSHQAKSRKAMQRQMLWQLRFRLEDAWRAAGAKNPATKALEQLAERLAISPKSLERRMGPKPDVAAWEDPSGRPILATSEELERNPDYEKWRSGVLAEAERKLHPEDRRILALFTQLTVPGGTPKKPPKK